MIVEDNSEMRFILANALVATNREIIPAVHGVDALTLFQDYNGKLDAIITDYEMPEMDGLELARSLREQGFQGCIVVMSGGMTPHKLAAFREVGICGFFPKPFEVSRLIELLFRIYRD